MTNYTGLQKKRVLMADSFKESELIPRLQAIQKENSYLTSEKLYQVAEELGISVGQVFGVATFYEQFRFKPAGKHTIRVCVGTACHVKNALWNIMRSNQTRRLRVLLSWSIRKSAGLSHYEKSDRHSNTQQAIRFVVAVPVRLTPHHLSSSW